MSTPLLHRVPRTPRSTFSKTKRSLVPARNFVTTSMRARRSIRINSVYKCDACKACQAWLCTHQHYSHPDSLNLRKVFIGVIRVRGNEFCWRHITGTFQLLQ